ncbi:MAG: type II secretion system F family protein [Planctomycetes bacterium]|nr:type II secretion system F family protein [Planctomycetota bacterium]NUQ33908.1 type II secretion system F family protein [Planctomycetaceae bacterium]
MPLFAYEALTADGKRTTGEIEAADRTAAISEIRNSGLKPTKVAQRAGAAGGQGARRGARKSPGEASQAGAPAAPAAKKIKGRVRGQDLVNFANQFAVLQDAGLPVVRSLKVLSNQQKKGPLKAILEDLAASVESGTSLSDAMASHPKTFDKLFCNMIRAGEVSGNLDVILNRLSGFLEKAQRLKKKVIGASIYPIVVMGVAVLILSAIIIFVVPAFEQMFTKQGMELPMPTKILLWTSRNMTDWPGLVLVIFVFTTIIGIQAWGRTHGGRRALDRIKLKVPIIGVVVKKSTTSRFCRTLATLQTSGVAILEALTICREAINNEVLAEAIDQVVASIKEGESIAAPLSKTDLFDDIVVNMIDVGEETGELDKMLSKVADTFDVEVDIAVESMLSVLEPILIVFMGGAIGFIVISLFLPMVEMIKNIQ